MEANLIKGESYDRGLSAGRQRVEQWLAARGEHNYVLCPLKRRYVGGVFLVRSPTRPALVCKTGDLNYDAKCEAEMLDDLRAAGLAVPIVVDVEDGLLAMEALPARPADVGCILGAGGSLARLHLTPSSDIFGYARETYFGVLSLPNSWNKTWSSFFVENRLRYFTEAAKARGHLDADLSARIERAILRVAEILPEPANATLLHGDVWSNNIVSVRGEPYFLDPASFHGDPDYDLAFMITYLDMKLIALRGYTLQRKPGPGFFSIKLPIYRLGFSLAHLALFGRRFHTAVERDLDLLAKI